VGPSLTPVAASAPDREVEVQKRKLRESCREFESVMLNYLMKTMREGMLKAEEPEQAREMYEDMLSQQLTHQMGKSGALGLGDMLYASLEPLIKAKPSGNVPGSTEPAAITGQNMVPDADTESVRTDTEVTSEGSESNTLKK